MLRRERISWYTENAINELFNVVTDLKNVTHEIRRKEEHGEMAVKINTRVHRYANLVFF